MSENMKLNIGGVSGRMILDENKRHIATAGTPSEAEHIVKCVNMHDELVVTIRGLLKAYSKPDEQLCCNGRGCGCQGATVRQMAEYCAREALAKARGETQA